MQTRLRMFLAATILSVSAAAHAGITIQMRTVDEKGPGKSVGQVVISDTSFGVVFSP